MTRNVDKLAVGQCGYSHICREDGGILDDLIVSRYDDYFLVVCNASNREKLLGWFDRQRAGFDVQIKDRTFETAMVALQGPDTFDALAKLLPVSLEGLKRYHFRCGTVMGVEASIARSGYTGEEGVEITMPANLAMMAVNVLSERRADGPPALPAGLRARDTLRLEAAMPCTGTS